MWTKKQDTTPTNTLTFNLPSLICSKIVFIISEQVNLSMSTRQEWLCVVGADIFLNKKWKSYTEKQAKKIVVPITRNSSIYHCLRNIVIFGRDNFAYVSAVSVAKVNSNGIQNRPSTVLLSSPFIPMMNVLVQQEPWRVNWVGHRS